MARNIFGNDLGTLFLLIDFGTKYGCVDSYDFISANDSLPQIEIYSDLSTDSVLCVLDEQEHPIDGYGIGLKQYELPFEIDNRPGFLAVNVDMSSLNTDDYAVYCGIKKVISTFINVKGMLLVEGNIVHEDLILKAVDKHYSEEDINILSKRTKYSVRMDVEIDAERIRPTMARLYQAHLY